MAGESEVFDLNLDQSLNVRKRKNTVQRRSSDPTPFLIKKFNPVRSVFEEIKLVTGNVAEKCIKKIQNVKTATKDVAERCITSGYELLSHAELPDWLKDNEFITNLHRPHLKSVKICFKSMLSVHAETGNIWTHLLGQILFVIAVINFYFTCNNYQRYTPKFIRIILFWLPSFWTLPFSNDDNKDKFPLINNEYYYVSDYNDCYYLGMRFTEHVIIGSFFFGATFCLLFSWLFHTLYCHSQTAYSIFRRLDYAGICSLITTSSYPHIYYAFRNRTHALLFYYCFITFFGVLCIIVSSLERFSLRSYRAYRGLLFGLFGTLDILPFIHILQVYGWNFLYNIFGGKYVILSVLFYLIGVLAYSYRIPEIIFPGYFNILFQSHQILHVCVVFGLFAHFKSIHVLVHNRSYF